MSTLRVHNELLNEYCAISLLEEETIKRDYALTKIKAHGGIDKKWKGGTIPVPFVGSRGGSIRHGALVGQSDIQKMKPVRGTLTTPKEIWGAMHFDERDLMEHDGSVAKASFIDSILEQMEPFVGEMQENFSIGILNKGDITTITSGHASNTGQIVVAHPERLKVHQRVEINDGTTATTGYIKSINLNTGLCPIVTARGGSTGVDLSAAGYSAGVSIYNQGGYSNRFTTLRQQILPAADGGDSTLFGVTKTDYPYLQAISASGAAMTQANILDKIFDHLVKTQKVGKGKPTEVMMSLTNLGYCMKKLESGSGPYRHVETKATPYNYLEITIFGPSKGNITLVGVNEMPDDLMFFMDWSSVKFFTNGFYRKVMSPDGNAFFPVRDETNGYSWIVDWCMYGEIAVVGPNKNGILHSIPTTMPAS